MSSFFKAFQGPVSGP